MIQFLLFWKSITICQYKNSFYLKHCLKKYAYEIKQSYLDLILYKEAREILFCILIDIKIKNIKIPGLASQ